MAKRYLARAVGALALLMVSLVMVSGCGNASQGTPEEAARSLMEALISGDHDTVTALNRSHPLDAPTSFLIEEAAKAGVTKMKLSDLTFTMDGEYIVVKHKTSDFTWRLHMVDGGGGKCYFLGFM